MEEFPGLKFPDTENAVEAATDCQFTVRRHVAGVHIGAGVRQTPHFTAVLLHHLDDIIAG